MSERAVSSQRFVAKPFKDLIKEIVSLFGTKEELTLIGVLVEVDSIDEAELQSLMKFDKTTLHRLLSRLIRDRLVCRGVLAKKFRNKLNGKPQWFYYPNYATLLDVIRLKIHGIREKIMSQYSRSDKIVMYQCLKAGCKKFLKEVDIFRAFDPKLNLLFCPSCKGVLEEKVDLEGQEDLHSKLSRFNAYTERVSSLMQKCDALYDLKALYGVPKPRCCLNEEEIATTVHIDTSESFRRHGCEKRRFSTEISQLPRKKAIPQWFSSDSTEVQNDLLPKENEVKEDSVNREAEVLLRESENGIGYISSDEDSDTEDEVSVPIIPENTLPVFDLRSDLSWAQQVLPWRQEYLKRVMSPCDSEESSSFTSYS